ncbi:hypothetical protein Poli38472_007754 [Pythium oligandrum]|uniref:Uncharacterized protein n=1 Tax=Pythium oligandrum TaxID=41045 RepID=A0A8K1CSR8_PYTOL|nr:hypothetical protein Poli38472_007754 [Pythium oligandrum]|eukprot:TMW68082.1 hypothetical protein Poli38472_007754 [Pythium oligandrum]
MQRRLSRRARRSQPAVTPETTTESTYPDDAVRAPPPTPPRRRAPVRLTHSPSDLMTLLEQAHQHLDRALTPEIVDGLAEITPPLSNTPPPPSSSLLVRLLRRKKQQLLDLTSHRQTQQDARFRRLHQHTRSVQQHVEDTIDHRQQLEAALAKFQDAAVALAQVLPPDDDGNPRVMATSRRACFLKTFAITSELVKLLQKHVATHSTNKLHQFHRLNDKLAIRAHLQLDVVIAKREYQQAIDRVAKTYEGAVESHQVTQHKQEFHALRRRLRVINAAMEHVFAFHAHVASLIVAPEMEQVHCLMHRWFEKHACIFQKNVKKA